MVNLIRANGLDEAFAESLHPSVRGDYAECLAEKRREDEVRLVLGSATALVGEHGAARLRVALADPPTAEVFPPPARPLEAPPVQAPGAGERPDSKISAE